MTEPAYENPAPVKDRVLSVAYAELADHDDLVTALNQNFPESPEHPLNPNTNEPKQSN